MWRSASTFSSWYSVRGFKWGWTEYRTKNRSPGFAPPSRRVRAIETALKDKH